MKDVSFYTIPKTASCPVIKINNMNLLFDTGAFVPVFSLSPQYLEKEYRAILTKRNLFVTGFGGNIKCNVYKLNDFKLGMIHFKSLEVKVPVHSEQRIKKFPFIIPPSMFPEISLSYDIPNRKLTFYFPNIESTVNRTFEIMDLKNQVGVISNGHCFVGDTDRAYAMSYSEISRKEFDKLVNTNNRTYSKKKNFSR